MKTYRILALAAAGLITTFLFIAIANGMPIGQPLGGNTNEMRQGDRAILP